MAEDFDDLPVVPLDDDDIVSPEDDVAQAAESALTASAAAPSLAPVAAPQPIGMTWLFDWQVGRFVRQGGRPAEVRGQQALVQRVLLAINTARFRYPGIPNDFGFDRVDDVIGTVAAEESLSDFERRLDECAASVPGCVGIEDFSARLDSRGISLGGDTPGGAFIIDTFTVVSDSGERVPLGPVSVGVGA